MEGQKKSLVLTRTLMLVILLGVTAIIASPQTQTVTPRLADYGSQDYHRDFVLNDEFPMMEISYIFGDKIVIEELTTNGSSVVIQWYESPFSNTSFAVLQNVTRIQDVYVVGAPSNWTLPPTFRVTRQENNSVQVNLVFRIWGYPYSDYYIGGPSGIELLAIPLIYLIYKNWGCKPSRNGYALLFMLILSATLIAPLYVFTYNNESALIKNEEILSLHTHAFMLNASNPVQEFNESVSSAGSDVFIRIANLTTNGVPVSVSFILSGIDEMSDFHNVSAFPSSTLQFEIPTENMTGLAVRVGQIAQNATIGLSIETIRDVWIPRNNVEPYYISAIVGLAIFVIALVFPQKPELLSTTHNPEEP